MASKAESKDIMIAADVPVTPGYHASANTPDAQSDSKLWTEAQKIGM